MPKKIRELKSQLTKAGFILSFGKGSHTKWYHPLLSEPVILSGKDSNDAKRYQEREVSTALQKVAEIKIRNDEKKGEK